MRAYRRTRDVEIYRSGKSLAMSCEDQGIPTPARRRILDNRYASVEPWISEYLIRLVLLIIYTRSSHGFWSRFVSFSTESAVDRIEVALNQLQ